MDPDVRAVPAETGLNLFTLYAGREGGISGQSHRRHGQQRDADGSVSHATPPCLKNEKVVSGKIVILQHFRIRGPLHQKWFVSMIA